MNVSEIDMLLKENIRRLNLHPKYHRRLTPSIENQIQLTQKWILAYQDEIIEDIRQVRREVDECLVQREAIKRELRQRPQEYPYGFCKQIRDEMFTQIKIGMSKDKLPGLSMLKKFIGEGGIIQPFWGIDKGIYFQNAIQIGDSILDVANDTVDVRKDPLAFYPTLVDAPIKRIDSFVEFAHVAQSYWHQELYPNIYIPEIAPVFPIIAVKNISHGSGFHQQVMLQAGIADLYYANVFTEHNGSWLGLAQQFICDSEYSNKRLSPLLVEQLYKHIDSRNPQLARLPVDSVMADFSSIVKEFGTFSTTHFTSQDSASLLQAIGKIRDMGLRLC